MKKLIYFPLCAVLCLLFFSCHTKYGYSTVDCNRPHFYYKGYFGKYSTPPIRKADKIVKKAAAQNNNAFYFREGGDSIYVWTYTTMDSINYITIYFVNPDNRLLTLTQKYPFSLDWLSDKKYDDFFDKWEAFYNDSIDKTRYFAYQNSYQDYDEFFI